VTNQRSHSEHGDVMTGIRLRTGRPFIFYVELRLSPRWVGGNIGGTDATKTCHILNAFIFETNNRKVINNTPLDSL
jgi:hypothetical protein